MNIILTLILIPFFYCLATLTFCSFYGYLKNQSNYIFPIKSLLFELFIQYIIIIILPIENYESNSNKIAILLPGYSETQFVFWRLRRQLKQNNISYKTIKYKSFFGDLTKLANDLKLDIDLILKNNSNSEIYIIGHSMGGLVGRFLLENNYYNNCCLIMIATPHSGTFLSKIGFGKCAKQMRPNSKFITSLSNIPINNSMNFYSVADSLICPRISAVYIKNNYKIKNQPLHNGTLFSRHVSELIIERIKYGKYYTTN